MDLRSMIRLTLGLTLCVAAFAPTAGAQTLECGNAFYDDGEPTDWTWFGGEMAGDPDYMFAVRFDLADFGYEPGQVEITGVCAGNTIDAGGGLYPNEFFIHPDNEGLPDDSVLLARGTFMTGNGLGESIVMFDEPVRLDGDFWLVVRGIEAYYKVDFNIEHDAEPDAGHSYDSNEGIENLVETVLGDFALRAYLEPIERSYLVAGAAHLPGSGSSEWRTKLALLNLNENTVEATASFIEGEDSVETTGAILPGQLRAFDDALAELFGITEPSAGSIRVDSTGPLVVTTRTYSQNEAGTVGQFLPGLAAGQAMVTGDIGVLSQLSKSAEFRTNIGFINFSEQNCHVTYTLYDAEGHQVGEAIDRNILPSAWRQDDDVFTLTGAGPQDNAYAIVEVTRPNCTVWCYASVVDTLTSDPTTIPVVIW
jgi:hypothetical protein